MSRDRPSSTGDSNPGKPDRPGEERRLVNGDLSKPMPDWMRGDRPRPVNWGPSTPMPDWVRKGQRCRDRPRENDEHGTETGNISETGRTAPGTDGTGENRGPAREQPRTRDKQPIADDPDKPQPLQADAPNGSNEGTRGGDRPAESTDKPEATDKGTDNNAERAQKLETELAETKTELAETKAERGKLIDMVSRQHDRLERKDARIERQDARIEKLESDNDKLRDQNDRLKARVAELEKADKGTDKPAETLDSRRTNASEKNEVIGEPDRKRRIGLPGAQAATVFTGAVGSADTIATATHVMTSGEAGIIGAVAGFGAAAYLWGKDKYEKRKEKR